MSAEIAIHPSFKFDFTAQSRIESLVHQKIKGECNPAFKSGIQSRKIVSHNSLKFAGISIHVAFYPTTAAFTRQYSKLYSRDLHQRPDGLYVFTENVFEE